MPIRIKKVSDLPNKDIEENKISVSKIISKLDSYLGIKSGIKISKLIRANAKIALDDIKSGKIFEDDESAKNLANVIQDLLKGSLIGAIYLIPGSSIPFTIIRNILKSSKNNKIRKILEFTVSKEIHEKD